MLTAADGFSDALRIEGNDSIVTSIDKNAEIRVLLLALCLGRFPWYLTSPATPGWNSHCTKHLLRSTHPAGLHVFSYCSGLFSASSESAHFRTQLKHRLA